MFDKVTGFEHLAPRPYPKQKPKPEPVKQEKKN